MDLKKYAKEGFDFRIELGDSQITKKIFEDSLLEKKVGDGDLKVYNLEFGEEDDKDGPGHKNDEENYPYDFEDESDG